MPRLIILLLLALAASLRAAPLAFRWSSEISEALPFAANAMQGETFDLVAEAIQYGEPLIGEASATFYWQTPDMEASSWYAQPAQWDADAATASVTWTPAMDVGSSAYRFFFCVSSEAGKNYRLYGTIRLKPSPGFSPAALEPVDVRDELAAEIADDVIGEIDGRYLKLTGGDVTGPITSRLSSASVPGLTVTLGNDDRYYAKHTQAGIQARREVNAPEEFYAFFDVSGGDKIARLKDLGSFLSEESDPTVPAWAKAETKPSYAWSEIAGKPATYAPSAHTHAVSDVDGLQAALDEKQPAGDYARISGDWTEPDEIVIPEDVRLAEIFGAKLRLRVTDMAKSELLFEFDYFDDTGAISRSESCNVYRSARVDELLAGHTHSQYLTAESDPTVPAWAKAASKPAYAWSEITGKPTAWAWSAITGKPATYAPSAHTHAVSDISGLQTALKERAPIYSVTATRDGTTYVWVWDDDEGTFALAPVDD